MGINTRIVSSSGQRFGTTTFPAVPTVGQILVYAGGRYVIEQVEWHVDGPTPDMVLVVGSD